MRVNDRPIGMVDPAKRRMRKDDMAAPAVTLTADIADDVLKKANKMKENIKKGQEYISIDSRHLNWSICFELLKYVHPNMKRTQTFKSIEVARAFRDKLVDDLISLATLAGRGNGTSAAVAHGAEDVAYSGHGEPYSESDGEPRAEADASADCGSVSADPVSELSDLTWASTAEDFVVTDFAVREGGYEPLCVAAPTVDVTLIHELHDEYDNYRACVSLDMLSSALFFVVVSSTFVMAVAWCSTDGVARVEVRNIRGEATLELCVVALSATFQYIVTYCEDIIVTSPFDNVWQESLDAVYSSKTSLITRSGPARFAFPYAYFCTDEACLSHLHKMCANSCRGILRHDTPPAPCPAAGHHLQGAPCGRPSVDAGVVPSCFCQERRRDDRLSLRCTRRVPGSADKMGGIGDGLLCKIMFGDEHLCEGSDDLLKFYKKKLYTNRADIVKKLVCSKASISIVLQDGGAIVAAHTLARCRTRAGKDLWYTKLLVATRDERRLSKKLDERVYAFFREYSTPVYYRLTQSVGFDYKNFGGKARRQLSRKADLENARGYWTKHMRCDDAAIVFGTQLAMCAMVDPDTAFMCSECTTRL